MTALQRHGCGPVAQARAVVCRFCDRRSLKSRRSTWRLEKGVPMQDFVQRNIVIPIERFDAGARTISGVISSSSLDAFGEEIVQSGMTHRATVPLLWAHRHDQPPIGRAISITRDGDKTRATFELSKTDPVAQRIH